MRIPVKVFERVARPGVLGTGDGEATYIAKFAAYLEDRPGSLARFASLVAKSGGNIAFFHYDRSVDASRVALEVQFHDDGHVSALVESLAVSPALFAPPEGARDDVAIASLESVLEMKVRLADEPGALAVFARLLKAHDANVIYMLYDEDIDEESVDIALATESPDEVDRLLGAVTDEGYRYSVVYRGSEGESVERIIGLKQVERFYLRLRGLVPEEDVEEIRALVESSQDLSSSLVEFYRETGSDVEAADVFEKVLALASMARTRTGDRFTATGMLPLQITDKTRLFGFRLPTSENVYVFEHGGDLAMIDGGYGIYYEDVKRLLSDHSLDPARVKWMFVTHPDTDHTGTAGYFEEEFGTEIFMHAPGQEVIDQRNRGPGVEGPLGALNKHFTRLLNGLTRCRYPAGQRYFADGDLGDRSGFRAIDAFTIGGLEFEVLESKGGHIAGQVFFVNREYGLCFTSDFLINIESLTDADRRGLSVYSGLLINVNSDSAVYREETAALKNLVASLDADLRKRGRCAFVFPGHGAYYQWAREEV